jgi:hypothetical protein
MFFVLQVSLATRMITGQMLPLASQQMAYSYSSHDALPTHSEFINGRDALEESRRRMSLPYCSPAHMHTLPGHALNRSAYLPVYEDGRSFGGGARYSVYEGDSNYGGGARHSHHAPGRGGWRSSDHLDHAAVYDAYSSEEENELVTRGDRRGHGNRRKHSACTIL